MTETLPLMSVSVRNVKKDNVDKVSWSVLWKYCRGVFRTISELYQTFKMGLFAKIVRGGGFLLFFFENRKKKFVFERKRLEIVSKVSPRKNTKFDPCGAFFLVVFTKYLSKGPNSIRPPCPERFLVACQLLCLTKSNRPLHFISIVSLYSRNIYKMFLFLNIRIHNSF